MTTTSPTATWSPIHTAFPNGSAGKVYVQGAMAVVRAAHLERGAEGWAFQWTSPVTGLTETHHGFRTMSDAKAAAVLYTTSPVGTPIPR